MDILLNESRQVYISKINTVQDYIERHLEDKLCIEDLATIASFSEFHFQRIYRQITRESLHSYIKRLRLEKAELYTYASVKNLVREDAKWFTIYHDFGNLTMEEKLRLSVCMSITGEIKATGEFGSMDIAGGQYAVGRFSLQSDEYQGAWDYMLSKWLPESGYMLDDRLCFEYYPPQEYTTEKEGRIVEIFIPITPL